jgi:RNA polymerase sigma factor (sigma-70 family)
MTDPHFSTAFRRWLHDMSSQALAGLPDGQLLERFARQRDEAAFETLLQRHGALVLGVCRRLLGDVHDADDAFQATFLVLACRAAAIRRRESLASFLYGTACRVARRLRGQKARLQALHRQAARQRPEAFTPSTDDRETHALLHEELERLPRKYRDVLILCYLQGKTNEQAAHELGFPLGSMSRRLGRARELLRDRLLGRGVGVLAALVGPALAEQAMAGVPAALVWSTVETVRRHGIATALLASSTPPTAVVLARGVLYAARLTRLTITTTLLAVGLAVAGGATVLHSPAAKQPPLETKTPAPAADHAARAKAPPRLDLYGDPLPEGVLARMGTKRLRHGYATQLVFAADGKTLLSAGRDQTVRLWDLVDGKLKRLRRMPLPADVSLGPGAVTALSSDGKTLAQVAVNHLLLWDVAAAREMRRIPIGNRFGDRAIEWLDFSPDGKMLAGGDFDSTVLLWDVARGKEKQRFHHKDRMIWKGAFSPDGKALAACGDNHLIVWDLAGGKELRTLRLPAQRGRPNALLFSPDGQTLAYSNMMETIFWRASDGEQQAVLRFDPLRNRVLDSNLAFSPDRKYLAIGAIDGIVLWDREARKEVKKLDGYHNGSLCFSPDGKLLASLYSGKIRLWDVENGKQLQERTSHEETAYSIAFSPDGTRLVSASGGDDAIRLWDVRTGEQVRVLSMPGASVRQLAFSADGTTLAVGGTLIQLWEARTGKKGRTFRLQSEKPPLELFLSLHLSSDGKRLTVLGVEADITDGFLRDTKSYLTIWDVPSGNRLIRRPCPPSTGLTSFSPDGKLVALPGKGLTIHDIAANRDLQTFKSDLSAPTTFSPDSKIVAINGGSIPYPGDGDPEYRKQMAARMVQLCDVASGEELLKIPTGATFWREFSPDGRYLATAWMDGLHLWEIATGKEVLYQPTHEKLRSALARSFASCLAFSPDGRSVATGQQDTSILIWDLAPATRQKRQLTAEELDRLWIDLAGDDAPRAYQAAGTLIADPERSVPFLRDRLHAVKEDAPRIRKLIVDLNSEQFAVRDAARKELETMDDAAHAVLRQALKDATSLEQRRRLEALLSVGWVVRSPEKLRQVRAVTVLEQIGDARRVLERLAAGAAEARQTREAKTALQRLANIRR